MFCLPHISVKYVILFPHKNIYPAILACKRAKLQYPIFILFADLDGDDGYYTDIEVPDGDVHNDVAEMIYDDYFRTGAELTNATQLKKLTRNTAQ